MARDGCTQHVGAPSASNQRQHRKVGTELCMCMCAAAPSPRRSKPLPSTRAQPWTASKGCLPSTAPNRQLSGRRTRVSRNSWSRASTTVSACCQKEGEGAGKDGPAPARDAGWSYRRPPPEPLRPRAGQQPRHNAGNPARRLSRPNPFTCASLVGSESVGAPDPIQTGEDFVGGAICRPRASHPKQDVWTLSTCWGATAAHFLETWCATATASPLPCMNSASRML